MAVYTHLGAVQLASLIAHYDVGELVSAKGIAEGISNSNWLIETTGSGSDGTRFILTMYERRIELDDLPFFLSLLDHLSAQGCPVPRTVHDRSGAASRIVDSKAVALIEFLPGISVDQPTAGQAYAVGEALAQLHTTSAGFDGARTNDLRPADWDRLLNRCGPKELARINADLPGIVSQHLTPLISDWPEDLPRSIIHADLFPDNVLMLGDKVSGLIDFYFACRDITAYDLAVTHTAWCFADEGRTFLPEISEALLSGYTQIRPLSKAEHAALPLLAKGAAMRFLATRCFDWIDTPADALVTRKDPMDFARRLQFYAGHGEQVFAQ